MLKLEHITAGYGKKMIIKNISLEFFPGQIYTIVGKNGCGKSTLLKTCADMLSPSSGKIVLQNRPMTDYQPLERAREISYLSQHRNTPNITVERLLMHGRHPHMSHLKQMRQVDWDKLEQVLEQMDIRAFRHHSLSALSGGERQRVYLAMLLAQDAPIMLLDEPTTYMDIAYQLSFLEMMKQLKTQGKTIIMVLHDLNQALQVSDQMIVMDDGSIIAQGIPGKIISSDTLQQVFHIGIGSYGENISQHYHMFLQK